MLIIEKAFYKIKTPDKIRSLLFNQDSNLDKQDQNLLCCHYTIEQGVFH